MMLTDRNRKMLALAAVLLTMALATHLVLSSTLRTLAEKQADLFGYSMTTRLAEQVKPHLLEQDLIRLNVIVQRFTHDPLIAYAAVQDGSQRVLTEAGMDATTHHELAYETQVQYRDNQVIGQVRIQLDSRVFDDMIGATLWHFWRWTLLLVACATAALLAYRHRFEIEAFLYRQRDSLLARQRAEDAVRLHTDEAESEAIAEHTFELQLIASNYAQLKRALTPRYLESCFDRYIDLLEQAVDIYQGLDIEADRPVLRVRFYLPADADDEQREKRYFDAICAAELFIGLVDEVNARARKSGVPTLNFHLLLITRQNEMPLDDHTYFTTPGGEAQIDAMASSKQPIYFHLDKLNRLYLAESDLHRWSVGPRLLFEQDDADEQQPTSGLRCVNTLSGQYRQLINRQIQHLLHRNADEANTG